MDTYAGGYFKALLDFKNYLDSHSGALKRLNTKKKYQTFIESMLGELVTNPWFRQEFREYGGSVEDVSVNMNTGKVEVAKL